VDAITIIFIDIAMAQIAAFGVTLAMIFHIESETLSAYLLPLIFVTLAAFVFSSLKYANLRIPLEAIIGISYAVATTAAVIALDLSAGAHEHTKEMLIGSILWVRWSQILKSVIIYSIIGAIHFIFRHKFIPLSEDYQQARQAGMKVHWWDVFGSDWGDSGGFCLPGHAGFHLRLIRQKMAAPHSHWLGPGHGGQLPGTVSLLDLRRAQRPGCDYFPGGLFDFSAAGFGVYEKEKISAGVMGAELRLWGGIKEIYFGIAWS